jgi:hypothetical protein
MAGKKSPVQRLSCYRPSNWADNAGTPHEIGRMLRVAKHDSLHGVERYPEDNVPPEIVAIAGKARRSRAW